MLVIFPCLLPLYMDFVTLLLCGIDARAYSIQDMNVNNFSVSMSIFLWRSKTCLVLVFQQPSTSMLMYF